MLNWSNINGKVKESVEVPARRMSEEKRRKLSPSNCENDSHISDDLYSEDDDDESVITNYSVGRKTPSYSGKGTRKTTKRRSNAKPVNRPPYKYCSHVKENHGQAVFGLAFNQWLGTDMTPVFATVGSNQCTVYECPDVTGPSPAPGLKVVRIFADADCDEVFYTCAWTYHRKTDEALLAFAGSRGVIRVMDIAEHDLMCSFIGHGQAINEIKFLQRLPHVLLSASKDHSVRMWNIETNVCIAIFGGVDGHRDEVLSVDTDLACNKIFSTSMDHSLTMWRIDTPVIQKSIELSSTYSTVKMQKQFPTVIQHYPNFTTRDVHRNYVDCVHWIADFVLSKSCENSIVCWKPGFLNGNCSYVKPQAKAAYTPINRFNYDECDIWFMRFGFNRVHHIIALGNQHGKVYVWEMDIKDPKLTHASTLNNIRCTSTVRQVSFSPNGNVLIAICDDGTVWRWNKKEAIFKKNSGV